MKNDAISADALTRFRAAASQFSPNAKDRSSRLEALREEIAALRAKRASFRTISELLGRCGIRASDTCVMRFCQRVLGEAPVRARKRKPHVAPPTPQRASPKAAAPVNGDIALCTSSTVSEAVQVALLDDLLSYQPTEEKASQQSGPRIAKIKFANPGEL